MNEVNYTKIEQVEASARAALVKHIEDGADWRINAKPHSEMDGNNMAVNVRQGIFKISDDMYKLPRKEVDNTILHEIAHILNYDNNNGAWWAGGHSLEWAITGMKIGWNPVLEGMEYALETDEDYLDDPEMDEDGMQEVLEIWRVIYSQNHSVNA